MKKAHDLRDLPLEELESLEREKAELERQLATRSTLAGRADVRSVLRALRIRNASDEPPDRLAALAERLGVDASVVAAAREALDL